jgi:hypothetical protein
MFCFDAAAIGENRIAGDYARLFRIKHNVITMRRLARDKPSYQQNIWLHGELRKNPNGAFRYCGRLYTIAREWGANKHAVYEQDFLDCSYGFRPGRGSHDALDEVGRAICREPTSVVLELDIASYFDSIVREQLMEMIERRVSDASVLRLIRKWINVGVIDDGRLLVSETGTGQVQAKIKPHRTAQPDTALGRRPH